MKDTIFGARPHSKLPNSKTEMANKNVAFLPKISENFP
jgi:hypothetical protein